MSDQTRTQTHLLLLDGELVLSGRLERRGQQLTLAVALPASHAPVVGWIVGSEQVLLELEH